MNVLKWWIDFNRHSKMCTVNVMKWKKNLGFLFGKRKTKKKNKQMTYHKIFIYSVIWITDTNANYTKTGEKLRKTTCHHGMW